MTLQRRKLDNINRCPQCMEIRNDSDFYYNYHYWNYDNKKYKVINENNICLNCEIYNTTKRGILRSLRMSNIVLKNNVELHDYILLKIAIKKIQIMLFKEFNVKCDYIHGLNKDSINKWYKLNLKNYETS